MQDVRFQSAFSDLSMMAIRDMYFQCEHSGNYGTLVGMLEPHFHKKHSNQIPLFFMLKGEYH
jgi:hypothetical protein